MLSSVNILFIDDDPIDRQTVQAGLLDSGIACPIHTASDGIEALAMLRGSDDVPIIPAPRIVLLDLNMPRMNGHEFLDALRADAELQSSVVFVLSTTSDPAEIQRCYDKGAAGFMSKDTLLTDFELLVDFLHMFERLVTFPD